MGSSTRKLADLPLAGKKIETRDQEETCMTTVPGSICQTAIEISASMPLRDWNSGNKPSNFCRAAFSEDLYAHSMFRYLMPPQKVTQDISELWNTRARESGSRAL